MPDEPSSLFHRRSIRLPGYDYSEPGAYFVTICTIHRKPVFGEIVEGEMRMNAWGKIVQDVWNETPAHFPNVELGEFVVMPNHVHAVIVINDVTVGTPPANFASPTVGANRVGAQHAAPLQTQPNASLNVIVRSFKSAVTKRINEINTKPGMTVWQRNYWEHIIRNQHEWDQISIYIQGNPAQWETDTEYFTPSP